MKLNWGHKLTLVFIVFVGMMATLIYKAMNTNFDLVTKEYYKDELAYQNVIDGTNNANNLSTRPSIATVDDKLVVNFPDEMKASNVNGTIWFYCAADASKDKRVSLQIAKGQQVMPITDFKPGKYTVKINWEQNNRPFYSEQTLFVY
jgi:hypothetical protein